MKRAIENIIKFMILIFGLKTGKILGVFLMAILPVVELRGSIPLGYTLGLEWYENLPISIIGNILPVPFILFFMVKIFEILKDKNILVKLIEKIEKRALKKSEGVKNKQFLGLLLFVALPLPGTGAWTGALIASMLKMDIKKSFICIFAGVCIAGILLTLGVYGIIDKIV